MRYYMDAALHPESCILDGLPTRRRDCDHRRLNAAGVGINPGRNQQIAAVPIVDSARAGHLDTALTDATGQRSPRSPATYRHDPETVAP